MGYVVFEDLLRKKFIISLIDVPVKIHKDDCRFYVSREPETTTVRWYGPFETVGEAEELARSLGKPWKRAECCP